jgi:hypothetical protein
MLPHCRVSTLSYTRSPLLKQNKRFNQAWRKRTTLSHPRFITQCCDAFEGSSIQTDILISPLIKTSELLSRVNDHFSYSDIDNAEIRGDTLLEMSSNSFLAELEHIKAWTLPNPLLKDNSESFGEL